MHDLAEGVVPAILELILTTIANTYSLDPSAGRARLSFSRKVIESRFENFSFFEGSPQLKWKQVPNKSGFKLDGTALQVIIYIIFCYFNKFLFFRSLNHF